MSIIKQALAATGVVIVVCLLCGFLNKEQPREIVQYTVRSGDCIWNIAEETRPEGMYILEYVDRIYDLNPQIVGRHLQAGEVINVYKK